MKDYVILTDSASNLPVAVREKYGIEFIPAHYKDRSGKDLIAFTDYSESSEYPTQESFFRALKANPEEFSTSTPSIPEMTEKLLSYCSQGLGVIAFAITSKMSGTYDFFCQARRSVLELIPDAQIYVVDALRIGCGIALMAVKAAELRAEGKSFEETVSFIEERKQNVHQMGWLDDLSFVARKGRITHAKAFFGTLIGIKPLGENNRDGMITVIGKAKGEKQAFPAMVEYVKRTIEDPENSVIFISHSDRLHQAVKYRKLLQDELHPKEIILADCNPSIGINVGPGLMCCYYYGKKVSEDLSPETKEMEKLLG